MTDLPSRCSVLSLPRVGDLLLFMVDSRHTCFVDVPWCVGAGGGAFVDHDVPQKVPFFGDDFYFRSVNCRMCHVSPLIYIFFKYSPKPIR